MSLQSFGRKVSEEYSDLDKDLNCKMVQAFYDIFYVSLFVMAQCIIMAVKSLSINGICFNGCCFLEGTKETHKGL